MRVRVAGCLVVLIVMSATMFVFASNASAQSLRCGAGGRGGAGSAGGYGVDGASGGSGTMPRCDQSTNGDSAPRMNCWAGGDAGEVVKKAPKEKYGGAGGVAANLGSSGNASASGGNDKLGTGGTAIATPGTGSANADGHGGPGGTALAVGSGTANAEGGSKGSTDLGRAGDGGSGTMPQCTQNTNGDIPTAGWAADAASGGRGAGVLGVYAARSAASAATSGGLQLAATGSRTNAGLLLAGLALVIGGFLLAASRPRFGVRTL